MRRLAPLLCLVLIAIAPRAHASIARALPGATRPAAIRSSAAGERMQPIALPQITSGRVSERVQLRIDLAQPLLPMLGIGSALTEASAYVLAQLPLGLRDSLLAAFYGPEGADYTMTRTHIGACDFTVKGGWSFDEVRGDTALTHFSLAPDTRGFPDARDTTYALQPLLRDALTRQPSLKIVASPWSAPAWMKDNDQFHVPGKGGGHLEPQYRETFARYMAKYVLASRDAGIPIWAVTPENEPLGVGGQWESMEMSADELREYIAYHLGPALAPLGVHILQYDQNRGDDAVRYSREALRDPKCAAFVYGTALHWYETTNSASTPTIDAIRALAPEKPILHTEGCIDALGAQTNSPGGRFLGWKNDGWWWRREATDWGWDWAPAADKPKHPKYAPVHRYARDLIDGLAHGLTGWIDWNAVLDSRGGPNHAHNLCGAPIMIDTAALEVYVTPVFDVMAHFSRYIRPGDHVLRATLATPGLAPDDLHALAVLDASGEHVTVFALNTTDAPITFALRAGTRHTTVTLPANALQTMRFATADLR